MDELYSLPAAEFLPPLLQTGESQPVNVKMQYQAAPSSFLSPPYYEMSVGTRLDAPERYWAQPAVTQTTQRPVQRHTQTQEALLSDWRMSLGLFFILAVGSIVFFKKNSTNGNSGSG